MEPGGWNKPRTSPNNCLLAVTYQNNKWFHLSIPSILLTSPVPPQSLTPVQTPRVLKLSPSFLLSHPLSAISQGQIATPLLQRSRRERGEDAVKAGWDAGTRITAKQSSAPCCDLSLVPNSPGLVLTYRTGTPLSALSI